MSEKGDRAREREGSSIPLLLEQGVSIISADYVVEYQNQVLTEKFGDLTGKLCYEGFFGHKQPCEICALRRAIESGRSETHDVETKDGRTYEFQFIPFRDAGGVMKVTEVTTDITERKRMEEALRQSEENYRTLVESSLTGIFIHQDGKYVFVNDRFARIHGYTIQELLGKHHLTLIHPDDREAQRQIASKRLGGQAVPQQYEVRRLKKDGKTIWCEVIATRIEYRGKPALLGNIVDITERKQVEQELIEKTREVERATQLKSEFLAHMSHELRTPLNAIIGFSELMMDKVPGEINEKQRQCLEDILSSGQHLLSLINDVLDLSKVESGKMKLRLTNIALTEEIEPLTRTMMPILAPRKQSLDVEIEEGLPPVHADKAKVRQVLLNLLSNAARFTPDGGKLKVEAVREDNWCQVSVIDNGIGINKEDQERMFEPFHQLDNPLTKEKGGTGLGLTVTKQIIERHGGRIWVESEYEKGSRFIFTLPLATAD